MSELDEIQRQVEELEPRVERLKALYQQYFMGIEKIPPMVLRKEVDRTIWQLRRNNLKNTRLRFKFQQIIQRYNTYQNYWARVMRQIENGTYERDVVRAAKRFGDSEVLTLAGRRAQRALHRLDEGGEPDVPVSWEIDEDESWDDEAITPVSGEWVPPELAASVVVDRRGASHAGPEPAGRPAAAQPADPPPVGEQPAGQRAKPAAPEPRASRPGALPGVRKSQPGAPRRRPGALPGVGGAPQQASAGGTQERTRAIYDEYLRARHAAGEPTAGISYEKLARTLETQTEALRKRHGAAAEVDYVVVTKDGKPMIRPVIK